jgi:hypothetical protein
MAEKEARPKMVPNTGSEDVPPGARRQAFDREQPPADGSAPEAGGTAPDKTQPAEEWGQREEAGRQIASGGKSS